MEQWPVISSDPAVQSWYEKSRAEGTSHALAEVFALQMFPGVRGTDSVFWAGRWDKDSPEVQEFRRRAEANGVCTKGKFYQGGLAEFPGDPRAFVSDSHDVLTVAKERGYKVTGAVNYTPPEGVYDPGPPQKPQLAEDLVEEGVTEFRQANPDATVAEAREYVIENHTYGRND